MKTAAPPTVEMSQIMPNTASLDQVSAKEYLQQNVFPKLESALNNLLETIEKNGEFSRYVDMLTEREVKLHRDLRRREIDRKRLEKGDAYDSAGDSKDDTEEVDDQDDDYDSESDEENQSVSKECRFMVVNVLTLFECFVGCGF